MSKGQIIPRCTLTLNWVCRLKDMAWKNGDQTYKYNLAIKQWSIALCHPWTPTSRRIPFGASAFWKDILMFMFASPNGPRTLHNYCHAVHHIYGWAYLLCNNCSRNMRNWVTPILDLSAFSNFLSSLCSNSVTSWASRSCTASLKCSLLLKMASFAFPTRPEGTDLHKGEIPFEDLSIDSSTDA